jgi:hypothetical protein
MLRVPGSGFRDYNTRFHRDHAKNQSDCYQNNGKTLNAEPGTLNAKAYTSTRMPEELPADDTTSWHRANRDRQDLLRG